MTGASACTTPASSTTATRAAPGAAAPSGAPASATDPAERCKPTDGSVDYGYCFAPETGADAGTVTPGYGPPLAPRVLGTWRRESTSLEEIVDRSGKKGGIPPDEILTVDVSEALLDSGQSTAAEAGQYDVESEMFGGMNVELSPARNDAERAAGVLRVLPRHLPSPVRLRLTVRREKRNNPVRPDDQLVLLVHSVARLAFPPPEPLPSTAVLLGGDADRWDRHFVVVTGPLYTGFETSDFGNGVWFSTFPTATQRCFDGPHPPSSGKSSKSGEGARSSVDIRVTGMVRTKGGQFGQMGRFRATIIATDAVALDPARPECR